MPVISSAAWVAHDLGLATAIGGALYGKLAMHPALRVADAATRDRVADLAWRRFSIWNLAAHGVVAASWLVGRSLLSGREAGAAARPLTLAKDVCVATSLASGVGATVLGRWLGRRVRADAGPASAADGRARGESRALDRAVDAVGTVNLLANVGALAATAVLAMRGAESVRFARASRRLP
jgi:hypothetical protein